MRRKIAVVIAGLAVLLAGGGCASSTRQQAFDEETWRKMVWNRGLPVGTTVYPFHASPEMVDYAMRTKRESAGFTPAVRLSRLQETLFDARNFEFAYDDRLTLTGWEAFRERRGNCLSFTSMFIALSRSIGIETFLVAVDRVMEAERKEGLIVVNRHVVAGYSEAGVMHTYDFYVAERAPLLNHRVVDDLTASAMYHTNVAGAAIRAGDYESARADLETAIRLDPELAAAWVNLGVARHRSGDSEGALAAYRRALLAEPGQPSALSNMAFVYRALGDEEKSRAALEAAAEGRSSPFTLIALAEAEMEDGRMRDAKRRLSRAKRSFGDEPEVYEALGRWATRSGKNRAAERYRRRAAELRSRKGDPGNGNPEGALPQG